MRKFFALMLALMLALGATGALAETALEPEVIINTAPELNLTFDETQRASAFPETQDRLTVENGVYTLLSNGITLVMAPPFGVLTLTQDMKNQLQDYMLLDNGRASAEFLVTNGLNAAFIDQTSGMEVWLFIEPSKASMLFLDSDADFDITTSLLQTMYAEENALSHVQPGEQRWISVRDKTEYADFLLYYVFKSGLQVTLQIRGQGITPEMVALMDSVAEGITFQSAE